MEFLFADALGQPLWAWVFVLAFVVALMVFDLGVLYRRTHEIGFKESLRFSAFYFSIGLLFAVFVWQLAGRPAAFDYLTGFVLEYSLAMDNLFVIAMIFSYFGIPRAYQHRVLIYGILGVIVLRGIMIVVGAAMVQRFEWVLLLFAAFLIFTGVKMLKSAEETYDVSSSPVLGFLRRHMRITHDLHGEHFFVRQPDPATGRMVLWATPLFAALVMVELADVIFAVDSIPAIFAITTDPYIVFTSNIFAILGLRALYFAIAALLHRFIYLNHALAAVLIFIGGKVIAAEALGIEKVPAALSLGVTVAILASGILLSLWKTARHGPEAEDGTTDRPLRRAD